MKIKGIYTRSLPIPIQPVPITIKFDDVLIFEGSTAHEINCYIKLPLDTPLLRQSLWICLKNIVKAEAKVTDLILIKDINKHVFSAPTLLFECEFQYIYAMWPST